MALSKKPVNGMKDILPEEMQIRDYVQQVIKETYRSFGAAWGQEKATLPPVSPTPLWRKRLPSV